MYETSECNEGREDSVSAGTAMCGDSSVKKSVEETKETEGADALSGSSDTSPHCDDHVINPVFVTYVINTFPSADGKCAAPADDTSHMGCITCVVSDVATDSGCLSCTESVASADCGYCESFTLLDPAGKNAFLLYEENAYSHTKEADGYIVAETNDAVLGLYAGLVLSGGEQHCGA